MSQSVVATPLERVRAVFDLYEFATEQIRRRAGAAAAADPEGAAEQAIRQWHRRRPGAEAGDGPQPSPVLAETLGST